MHLLILQNTATRKVYKATDNHNDWLHSGDNDIQNKLFVKEN